MHALISAYHRCFCRTFHSQIIPFYISGCQTLFSWASLNKRLTILYAYTFVGVNDKRKYLPEVLVNRLVQKSKRGIQLLEKLD